MSDAPEVTFDSPSVKPSRKKAKKKAKGKPVAAAHEKPTAPFPGMTRTACADACNANACAISQKPYCAHPTKGGLQAVDMNNPAALKRLQSARDQIDVRLDPDRFK